ncbi:MAG: PLP-dependent aminotransferase family protein [Bacteroidales bacterium]|nr:MAG: PLP-dependent aminotransferase family protein [Bacteroidales bacterium]
MQITYSEFAGRIKGSEIRELLKYTRKEGVISFAGGLPDPCLFPINDITRITREVLSEKGFLALQYGPTPGEPEMIDALVEHMANFSEAAKEDQICVTSSSQQGLDLVSLVMLDKDSEIIMELPSYLGAIQAFGRTGVTMNGIRLLDDGMDLDQLEEVLKDKARKKTKIRFIYVIPDYQNPSGIVMSLNKRRLLIEIASRWGVPIVEDSPYREINFNEATLPSLWTLSKGDGVIQLKTFSKMLLPGMRLGWITAQKEIIEKLALMKQSVDLCSPSFNQLIIARFIKEGRMKETIKQAIALYIKKNASMLTSLSEFMPEYVTWSKPTGGMFLWLTLPEFADAKEMLEMAAEKKVIYVPGKPFHCDGAGQNTLRLNYSFPTIPKIEMGIQSLAQTVKEFCEVKVKC